MTREQLIPYLAGADVRPIFYKLVQQHPNIYSLVICEYSNVDRPQDGYRVLHTVSDDGGISDHSSRVDILWTEIAHIWEDVMNHIRDAGPTTVPQIMRATMEDISLWAGTRYGLRVTKEGNQYSLINSYGEVVMFTYDVHQIRMYYLGLVMSSANEKQP